MNKKLKSIKLNTDKGITLIALIITIIVLLILAVVAIQAVKGDGILAHAKNARDKWEEATANEEAMLGNITNYTASQLDKHLEGVESENQSDGTTYEIIDVELQKGKYVNYHYKGDSGADTFISCMYLGSISGSEAFEEGRISFNSVCTLFPLSTLEDLSIYPTSGTSAIQEAEARWKSALGADVSNEGLSNADVLNILKELGVAKSNDNKSYLAYTSRSSYNAGRWNVISKNGDLERRICVDTMTDSYIYVTGGFRPFVILDEVEFGVLDNGKKGTSVVDAYDLVLK